MVSTGSAPAAAARWCSVLSPVFLPFSTACENHVTNLGDPVPSTPTEAIVDAPRGGKLGFYWLAPMVRQPTFSGAFDPNVTNAEVHICVLSGSACGTELVAFTTASTPSITIDPGGETYSVQWQTKAFNLDPSKFYRIRVLVGSFLLGYADVDVVSQPQDLKSVTSDFVGLVKDHPLNIKFRIETGILLLRFSVLDAGYSHTCAIEAETGNAYCWGLNLTGQLGTATPTDDGSARPVAVTGGLTFGAVSAGYLHTCAIASGTEQAYCWGWNKYGQLGTGTTKQADAIPKPVLDGLPFSVISAGTAHTCALGPTGTAYCWGDNELGQLGDGTKTSSTTPVAVIAP